jgi:hypothetical protein
MGNVPNPHARKGCLELEWHSDRVRIVQSREELFRDGRIGHAVEKVNEA